jgi:plastocyanin
VVLAVGAALGLVAVACGTSHGSTRAHAAAAASSTTEPPPIRGAQRLHYRYGPITIQPGQNAIQYAGRQVPKPTEDGWIVRIAPNIRRIDGSVPPVDVLHLHHGVWLNQSRRDATIPAFPERFFAAGEEKTTMELPPGFGYPYRATDDWVITYMIHDLFPTPDQIYIAYDIDFIPATAKAAKTLRPARPIWLDVQNGSVYPVFDALKGSGHNGAFTYPDDAVNPYAGGPPLNQWTVDKDGILIATAGHLHPGGLHDDLSMVRAGSTAHLFQSDAHYFEPAGAVSWDVAMTATPPTWRVAVHQGDTLRVSATYDTRNASWYESMGIMVVWMADGTDGADPFQQKVDVAGVLTHGHLPENDNHGGAPGKLADPRTFASGGAASAINIRDFTYGLGDYSDGPATVPTVQQGQRLTFDNLDAPTGPGIWHSITACQAPCNGSTGIAFPVANADWQFDSGQLGNVGPPTSGHVTWSTPPNLPPGVYTYFCRIHPFMRGAFRVVTATG